MPMRFKRQGKHIMEIYGNEYRIVETVFEDGHKEYKAQEAKRFLFVKYWEDYMICPPGVSSRMLRHRCVSLTYDDCVKCLRDDIERQIELKRRTTVKAVNKYI